jgi:hypothetical protein
MSNGTVLTSFHSLEQVTALLNSSQRVDLSAATLSQERKTKRSTPLVRIMGKKYWDSAPNVGTSQLQIRSARYPAAALNEWNQKTKPDSQHEP